MKRQSNPSSHGSPILYSGITKMIVINADPGDQKRSIHL